MTNDVTTNTRLSNAELLDEIKRLTANERHATARLIAALGELDARRLYLGEGCSSLFTYCTQVLHLSEHAAYLRIEAARAARKWPAILELVAEGALHLTAIGLLAPHLTTDNVERTLAAARHKSKREVEEIVAALRPQAAVPSSVRKLPATHAPASAKSLGSHPPQESARAFTRPAGSDNAPAQPVCVRRRNAEEVKPLAPERFKVQLTISRETHQMLREAQDLLRHQIPDGDIAFIFERALTLLVAGLRKSRHGAVNRPRGTSHCDTGRQAPASVKRAVWERDQGHCAFIGAVGRCTERGFLEYHHRVPYADGGATNPENLELRCRSRTQRVRGETLVGTAGGGFGPRSESELHAVVTHEVQLRRNSLRRRVEAEHVLHARDVRGVDLRDIPPLLLPRFQGRVLRQAAAYRRARNARLRREPDDFRREQRQRPPRPPRRRLRTRRRDQVRLSPATSFRSRRAAVPPRERVQPMLDEVLFGPIDGRGADVHSGRDDRVRSPAVAARRIWARFTHRNARLPPATSVAKY